MQPEQTPTEIATLIGAIAEAGEALDLAGSDTDVLDLVLALRPVLAPVHWAEVAAAWELCPTHACDQQICADDEDDCEAGRR